MRLAVRAAPTEVSVGVLQVRRLHVTPAVLVQYRAGQVGRHRPELMAPLELALPLPERSGGQVKLAALPGEAVLHLDVDRSAQRVQSEHWIGPFDVQAVDGV